MANQKTHIFRNITQAVAIESFEPQVALPICQYCTNPFELVLDAFSLKGSLYKKDCFFLKVTPEWKPGDFAPEPRYHLVQGPFPKTPEELKLIWDMFYYGMPYEEVEARKRTSCL